MTAYINLRGSSYGAVCSPYILSGDALAPSPAMKSADWNAIPILVRDKNVLLATHGFNVSYVEGLRSLGRLETSLGVRADEAFFGVLWPGDWIIPAINYPFESGIASTAGKALGSFCNQWLTSARSISMLSHSLGARVILEAIKASKRPIRRACITAGAVNDGCLAEEYQQAAANCGSIITLSSLEDDVLEFAYPPGDALADVLYPDHPPFETALGRSGPALPIGAQVKPYEIPNAPPYGHSNYFPPSGLAAPGPADDQRWVNSVQFMASVLRGSMPGWPS